MIKAVLIDDEPLCLETLQNDLSKYCPQITVLACFNQPKEGLAFLKKQDIDLLFLDIEMPEINGIQLLEQLSKRNFEVIFTTAFSNFAVTAFRLSAIDYLLKPIVKEELIEAVNKVLEKRQNPSVQLAERLSLLEQHFQKERLSRVALPTIKGFVFYNISDIVYCQADGSYTKIVLSFGRTEIISKGLIEVAQILQTKDFFRIHNSHLINLKHLASFDKRGDGKVTMSNKEVLKVARLRKTELLARIARM